MLVEPGDHSGGSRNHFPLRMGSDENPSERDFFALYGWCFKPTLSFHELLEQCGEELERYAWASCDWQREECLINLYVFACAIDCATDDYVACRALEWSPAHAPGSEGPERTLRAALAGAVQRVHMAASRRPLLAWKQRWSHCLEELARMLALRGSPPRT